jgi:hypothetical protein
VAATSLRVVLPLLTTMSGWNSLTLSSTVGTRRRPSIRTTNLATRTRGATSLSWSGASPPELAALWLTAPITTRGLHASTVVSEQRSAFMSYTNHTQSTRPLVTISPATCSPRMFGVRSALTHPRSTRRLLLVTSRLLSSHQCDNQMFHSASIF